MNEAVPQADEENYDLEILEIFLEEAAELIETITGLYQDWRANTTNLKITRELQRAYHTMKGGSRMAGVFRLGDFSYEMEHYYEKITNGMLAPSEAVFDLLERCHERTAQIVQDLTENTTCTRPTDLIEAIQQFGVTPVAEKVPVVEEAPVITEVPVAEEAIVEEAVTAEEGGLASLFEDAMATELGVETMAAPEEALDEITEEPVVEEVPVAEEAVVAVEEDGLVSLFDDAMADEMGAEPTAVPDEELEEIIEEPVIEQISAVEEAVVAVEEDGLVSLFDDAMADEMGAEPTAVPEELEEIIEEPVVEEISVVEEAVVAVEEDELASLFDDVMTAEMITEPTETPEVSEAKEIIEQTIEETPVVEETVIVEAVSAVEEIEEIKAEDSLASISAFDEMISAEPIPEPVEIIETVEEPIVDSITIVPESESTEPIFELAATPSAASSFENEAVGSEKFPEVGVPAAVPEIINQEETAQLQFAVEEAVQPTTPPLSTEEAFDKQVAETSAPQEVNTFAPQETVVPTPAQEIDIYASEKTESDEGVTINAAEQAIPVTEKNWQLVVKITSLLVGGFMACLAATKAIGRWIKTGFEDNAPPQPPTADTAKMEVAQKVETHELAVATTQAAMPKPAKVETEQNDTTEEPSTKYKKRGKNKGGNRAKEIKNKKNTVPKKARKKRQPKKK